MAVKEEEQLILEEKNQQNKSKAEKQALETLTLGQSSTQEFTSILIKQFKDMRGTTEEKIKKLFNRLQKFFLRDKGAKINIKDGYFCKKRQPFYQLRGVHVVQNQIILFGVDFVKHKQLIKAYQPEDFCPVDMSHVRLIYTDFFSAIQALRRNQREEVIENGLKLEPSMKEPPKGWMEMKPYYISNYERRVLARFATSEDLEIQGSRKLESNIPLFAKKVFDQKKQQSQSFDSIFVQRESRLKSKKFQKLQRSNKYQDDQNWNRANRKNQGDQISQKSYTLNIGRGINKFNQSQHDRSSASYRERSREKDFDMQSVRSKKSTLSSLAGKFDQKMKFDQKAADKQSVVSDASFILEQNEQNKQILMDMVMRLGSMNVQEQRGTQADQSFEFPVNQRSFVSSASTKSYRLSENMPDQRNDEHNKSCSSEKWNYTDYIEQQERQEQRRRKQEKQVVIVLDD